MDIFRKCQVVCSLEGFTDALCCEPEIVSHEDLNQESSLILEVDFTICCTFNIIMAKTMITINFQYIMNVSECSSPMVLEIHA